MPLLLETVEEITSSARLTVQNPLSHQDASVEKTSEDSPGRGSAACVDKQGRVSVNKRLVVRCRE